MAQACAEADVRCGGGVISGAGRSSVSHSAYQALSVQQTTLSQVLEQLGPPTSRSSLQSFLGSTTLSSLIANQPSGESCAYYLNTSGAAAFQLCFDSASKLAQKAILSSSG